MRKECGGLSVVSSHRYDNKVSSNVNHIFKTDNKIYQKINYLSTKFYRGSLVEKIEIENKKMKAKRRKQGFRLSYVFNKM